MTHVANSRKPAVMMLGAVMVTVMCAVTACQADILLTVDEEQDATIVISVGVSDSLAEFAGISLDDVLGGGLDAMGIEGEEEGQSEDESLDEDGSGFLGFLEDVGGNEVSRYEEDGYSGYRITQSLPASELQSNLDDAEGVVALADLVPQFEFRRTDSDDGWMLSGELELGSAIDDLAGGDLAEGFGGLFGMAMDQFEATLRVRLPGEIVESTAHRTENEAEVWDLLDPEGVSIHLVSREPTDFQVVPWLIAAAFAVLVLGIIIWQVRTRRKASRSEQSVHAPSLGSDQSSE